MCFFVLLLKILFEKSSLKKLKVSKLFTKSIRYNWTIENQKQSKLAILKKDLKLISKEEGEFTQGLAKELVKLAHEGIGFCLPIVVVDHVADTESNLSFIKSKIKTCAREGVEEGDGLNLFKIRRVPVNAKVKGELIPRTEIYRTLNNLSHIKQSIGH